MGKPKKRSKRPKLEEGDALEISTKKTLWMFLVPVALAVFGFLALIGSGLGCLLIIAGQKDPQGRNPVVAYIMEVMTGLSAISLLSVGAVVGYRRVTAWRGQENYTVGENAFQGVIGSEIRTHVPYDNIRDIVFQTEVTHAQDRHQTHLKTHFVGIKVMDPFRADTIVDRGHLKRMRREYGFDVVLFDVYEMSLDTIRSQLVDAWNLKRRF